MDHPQYALVHDKQIDYYVKLLIPVEGKNHTSATFQTWNLFYIVTNVQRWYTFTFYNTFTNPLLTLTAYAYAVNYDLVLKCKDYQNRSQIPP